MRVRLSISISDVANGEWSIDFKGWFRTADGTRCEPLTGADTASRYLIAARIAPMTCVGVRAALERVFRTCGLPDAIRSDNGSPFGGDSAGGNLAAVTAQQVRDRGGPDLAYQLLVYPVTDHAFDTDSYRENAEGYMLTRDVMRWFWDHYLEKRAHGSQPLASPLRAPDLANLPPALVITAEFDPLRDEGEAYAIALADHGVPATAVRFGGVTHGFFGWGHAAAPSRDANHQAVHWLRSQL